MWSGEYKMKKKLIYVKERKCLDLCTYCICMYKYILRYKMLKTENKPRTENLERKKAGHGGRTEGTEEYF
jgi:hypothetical protein